MNTRTDLVRISLSPANEYTTDARLRVEQPAIVAGVGHYQPQLQLAQERGAYVIQLKKQPTRIELK